MCILTDNLLRITFYTPGLNCQQRLLWWSCHKVTGPVERTKDTCLLPTSQWFSPPSWWNPVTFTDNNRPGHRICGVPLNLKAYSWQQLPLRHLLHNSTVEIDFHTLFSPSLLFLLRTLLTLPGAAGPTPGPRPGPVSSFRVLLWV